MSTVSIYVCVCVNRVWRQSCSVEHKRSVWSDSKNSGSFHTDSDTKHSCGRNSLQEAVSTKHSVNQSQKLCGSFHENNLINRLVIYIVKYRWCYRFYGQL